jgi:hypothetical protein
MPERRPAVTQFGPDADRDRQHLRAAPRDASVAAGDAEAEVVKATRSGSKRYDGSKFRQPMLSRQRPRTLGNCPMLQRMP